MDTSLKAQQETSSQSAGRWGEWVRMHWLWLMLSCWVVVSVALVWGSRSARCERVDREHVGAYKCRGCHEAAYKAWKTSAHAKAFSILPEKDRKNAQCLRCHSVGQESHLQGVQCESCHGAGKYYVIPEVMVDSNLARAVGLKVTKGAKGCVGCHVGHSPKLRKFDYKAMWKKIAHSK